MLQEVDYEVLGWVYWHIGEDIDLSVRWVTDWKRRTLYSGPRGSFLRKETAMQPKFGIDLVAVGTRSGE